MACSQSFDITNVLKMLCLTGHAPMWATSRNPWAVLRVNADSSSSHTAKSYWSSSSHTAKSYWSLLVSVTHSQCQLHLHVNVTHSHLQLLVSVAHNHLQLPVSHTHTQPPTAASVTHTASCSCQGRTQPTAAAGCSPSASCTHRHCHQQQLPGLQTANRFSWRAALIEPANLFISLRLT